MVYKHPTEQRTTFGMCGKQPTGGRKPEHAPGQRRAAGNPAGMGRAARPAGVAA